ncbi:MAG: protein kinase domain-containing protein [Pseudonocardia sp.]
MNAPGGTGTLLDGRYRVGPMIARGGMSTVHRGTDTRLDRPVAIKVMDPRLAGDPAFRARFEREARSAARIDHPAVVDVHDQGADPHPGPDPVLFLVMELVEGGTLRDVLRARGAGPGSDPATEPGAIGVPAAFAVLEPVLAGLAQAHRLGMVHRDVKPENVLISHAGEVKIADFGLVTAAAQAGTSHVGMIMGTVAYLSPEQVTTGAADARSDVYAAGILLYELLTGTPPFAGDTPISVAYRHVNSAVPAPSLVAGDVPPELDALVLRATDRDPAARFADADALLAELRALRSQLAVPAVPAPVPPRPAGTTAAVSAGPTGTAAYAGPGGTAAFPGPGSTAAGPALPGPGGTAVWSRQRAGTLPGHAGPARRGTRRRGFAAWVAVATVLALVVVLAGWWLGTGRWTAMPSVVGLERAAAERLLGDADLLVVVTPAFSDDVAAGIVAAADAEPDAELLRGSEVALTVSNGRPAVPEIPRGTALEVAERLVRDAGLTPVQDAGAGERRGRGDGRDGDEGRDEDEERDDEEREDEERDRRGPDRDRFDDDHPVGSVLRTDPAAGTVLAVGAPVALVLNVEDEQVTVPFLIGRSAAEARAALRRLDLRPDVRSQLPFGLGGGTVVGQDPGPGTPVEPGSVVVLTTL